MTDHQKTQAEIEDERRHRALTDEDVKAIADEFESRLVARFYDNLGRGVWGLMWKAMIGAIVIVAAYGAVRGVK